MDNLRSLQSSPYSVLPTGAIQLWTSEVRPSKSEAPCIYAMQFNPKSFGSRFKRQGRQKLNTIHFNVSNSHHWDLSSKTGVNSPNEMVRASFGLLCVQSELAVQYRKCEGFNWMNGWTSVSVEIQSYETDVSSPHLVGAKVNPLFLNPPFGFLLLLYTISVLEETRILHLKF